MKIVIPGGSGQVGTLLARALQSEKHEVVVLSRKVSIRPWRVVAWNGSTLGTWSKEIDGCDVVINLTGRSVNCRYTEKNRRTIMQSRILSTRVVGDAISRASHPPRLWLQASTATIYAHRYDAANNEATGLLGGLESDAPKSWKFSIDVAREWERALNEAIVAQTRRIALRSAMIMSPDHGGIFDTLLGLVKRGLGGKSGDGRQFVSWIHYEDFVRATQWLTQPGISVASGSSRTRANQVIPDERDWAAGVERSAVLLDMLGSSESARAYHHFQERFLRNPAETSPVILHL